MPGRRKLSGTCHRWGRLVALVSATALAAGTLAVLAAGPASAQTQEGETWMTLAYAEPYGAYAYSGVTSGSAILIDESPGTWETVQYSSSYTEDGVTGYEVQFEAVTSNGTISDLCLAATSIVASLATCGDNGTYWIAVASGAGYYLYSRYELNMGEQFVLEATNPGDGLNGVQVGIDYKPDIVSGDGEYARWAVVV
jgi:hypothetical protein